MKPRAIRPSRSHVTIVKEPLDPQPASAQLPEGVEQHDLERLDELGIQPEELLDAVETKDLARISELVAVSSARIHSGPIPSAAELEQYDKAHPGAAKIILDSFRDQNQHRQTLESMEAKATIRLRERGQWMAFAIGIGGLATSVAVTVLGYPIYGSSLIVATVAAFAGVAGLQWRRGQ